MNNRKNWCALCDEDAEDFDYHKLSLAHRFNFMLMEFNDYRSKIVKDSKGIVITASLQSSDRNISYEEIPKKGVFIVKLSPDTFTNLNHEVRINFKIKNDGSTYKFVDVLHKILHPYESFKIESKYNVNSLGEGDSANICVIYKLRQALIGSMKVPVGFTIQPQNATEKDKYFTIYREVIIHIVEGNIEENYEVNNPFKSEIWNGIEQTFEPLNMPKQLNNFPIPFNLTRLFAYGLKSWTGMSSSDVYRMQDIKVIIENALRKDQELYKMYYHYLLWLDEACAVMMLRKYNMSNVTMTVIRGDWLELEVPGLAEKRPSVIVGDIISIRVHNDRTCYKGVVCSVNDTNIYIKNVHEELVYTIREYSNYELDVMFNLSRLQYERMHQGVELCMKNGMITSLFPDRPLINISLNRIADNEFYNQCIATNSEQRSAVENILSGTSQYAPYIVFGPPGTGKTVTIVEAILQIKKLYKTKQILVCAPSNAACDMLTTKLGSHCSKDELLRLHSASRDVNTIDTGVVRFSNIEEGNYLQLRDNDLKKYRIIIATLHLIGKYVGGYSPHFVFIDEAAQATEPEADIAIGLLSPGKKIILAGDPKQLGPICASKYAEKNGLGTSLLERLMATNELYKPTNNNPLTYNVRYLTMLKNNYRSHPDILSISNMLFYDDSLKALSHAMDPISTTFLCPFNNESKYKNIKGRPVEFCAVTAKEERTGMSPSYFNQYEITIVVKYVKMMLSLKDCKVSQKDIGIIAPYIRQVHKIRMRLKDLNFTDVEVGTTESFQGQEKRIIIISTVRSQNSLLLYDQKYQLGFVKNERRFNVAITRAKSKVIVIGNPFVLCNDRKCWLNYIYFCQDKNAYQGAPLQVRTADVREEIMSRVHKYSKRS